MIQKRLLAVASSICPDCTTASVNPFKPKFDSNRLNVVTMATRPKSRGTSMRASTTVAIIWMPTDRPLESTVIPAPRTARRRSVCPPSGTAGANAPFDSKGFKA